MCSLQGREPREHRGVNQGRLLRGGKMCRREGGEERMLWAAKVEQKMEFGAGGSITRKKGLAEKGCDVSKR